MGTSIQRANGTIIYFDTAETVVKALPSRVTSHPIETGATITDHVVTDPITIAVVALISDAAFQLNQNDPFSEEVTVTFPDRRPNSNEISSVVKRVPIAGRAQKALQELEEIRDAREKFTIETRNEIFENMVFTAFTVPRDANTGQATRISFTAQQIEEVQRRFATVPQAVASDDADKASENAETGRQPTTPVETSILKDELGDLLEIRNPGIDVDDALDLIGAAG